MAGPAGLRARLAARAGAARGPPLPAPPPGMADLPGPQGGQRDPGFPDAGPATARVRAALHPLRRRVRGAVRLRDLVPAGTHRHSRAALPRDLSVAASDQRRFGGIGRGRGGHDTYVLATAPGWENHAVRTRTPHHGRSGRARFERRRGLHRRGRQRRRRLGQVSPATIQAGSRVSVQASCGDNLNPAKVTSTAFGTVTAAAGRQPVLLRVNVPQTARPAPTTWIRLSHGVQGEHDPDRPQGCQPGAGDRRPAHRRRLPRQQRGHPARGRCLARLGLAALIGAFGLSREAGAGRPRGRTARPATPATVPGRTEAAHRPRRSRPRDIAASQDRPRRGARADATHGR